MSDPELAENDRNKPSLSCNAALQAIGDSSRMGPAVLSSRLLVGLVVLVSAEVLSGASLPAGLWNPWTLLVTYWLYFAHFFFFATLAVRTGRTSFWSLYLWGVLFGLYESWITKVIWSGYNGDGKFAMGSIGPYGLSELTMVLAFHPIMSFIVPLAVLCLLCPSARRLFPELARMTGKSRAAQIFRGYLVLSFAPVMAMNSGGAVNLAANVAVAIAGIAICCAGPGRRLFTMMRSQCWSLGGLDLPVCASTCAYFTWQGTSF